MKQKLIAGMYGRFKPKPQYSPEQIRREMVKHLTGVFAWTGFCLLAAAGVASWVSTTAILNDALFDGYGPIFTGLASMLVFFFTGKYLTKSPWSAYTLCCGYWCAAGFALAVIFRAYTGTPVTALLLSAGMSIFLLGVHQYITSRMLSWHSPDIYIVGIAAFAMAALAYLFMQGHWPDYLFIAIGVGGSIWLIIHNLEFIQKQNKVGNEGTADDLKERVYGSLIVYLHVMLIFAEMLRYVRPKRKSGSSTSVGRGGSFGGGGARGKW